MTDQTQPLVAVLMGSASDAPVLEPCLDVLRQFHIPFEVRVLSAHRTPEETAAYVSGAEGRGIQVLVAAAGKVDGRLPLVKKLAAAGRSALLDEPAHYESWREIYGLSRDWRFTFFNRQAERFFNRSRDQVIGLCRIIS